MILEISFLFYKKKTNALEFNFKYLRVTSDKVKHLTECQQHYNEYIVNLTTQVSV